MKKQRDWTIKFIRIVHNKAWFGCFFVLSRLQNRSPQAQNCKKEPQMHRRPAFSQSAPNSQKSHQPSPFPTMVSILQPAISHRKSILLRPYAPIYKPDYQCINNEQFSLQHITKSQITISLIANHRPFYHRPLMGTPIRQRVYRGAQYWDKPHRRYR